MADYFSFGVIPIFVAEGGSREYLLLKSPEGYWGFPKGTPENGETDKETAIREAFEEAGIVVARHDLSTPVHYEYQQPIKGEMKTKRVVLYPILMHSKDVTLQPEEIVHSEWVDFDRAVQLVNLPTLKRALETVEKGTV